MRIFLIVIAVFLVFAFLCSCTHPKDYPQKIKEGLAGKKSAAAEAENVTYKRSLDEMQVVHEAQQKLLK